MYGSCVATDFIFGNTVECKADKGGMLFEVPHVSNLLNMLLSWKLNGIAYKYVQHGVGSIVKFKSY